MKFLSLLLIVFTELIFMSVPSVHAVSTVDLGAASSFSVLAALSMSATVPAPGTVTSHDLGLSTNVASSRTGNWTVGGVEYFGPLSLAKTAHDDALIAFTNMTGLTTSGGWGTNPWSPVPGVWTEISREGASPVDMWSIT